MAVPKSVIKIKKGNVEYISSVDYVNYNIYELSRAAMRDVGRYLATKMRASARKLPGSQRDRFVRYKTAGFIFKVPYNPGGLPYAEVGVKPDSWYTEEHENGSSKQPKRGIIYDTAHDNLDTIIEIESKYLSALNGDSSALPSFGGGEYSGEGVD